MVGQIIIFLFCPWARDHHNFGGALAEAEAIMHAEAIGSKLPIGSLGLFKLSVPIEERLFVDNKCIKVHLFPSIYAATSFKGSSSHYRQSE